MTNVYFAHFTQNCGLKLLGQLVVGACLFLAFLSSSLDERLSTVPAISLRTRSLFDRPFVGAGASEKTTATTTMSPVLSAWIEIRGREVERTEISRFGRMERVLNIAEVRRRNVDGSPYLSSVAVVAADADRVGAGNGISARRSQWRWQARTATTPSRISNIVTWNNHCSENAQGVTRRRIEAGFNPMALSLTSLIVAYTKYPKIWMAAELKIILLDYQNF